MKFKCYNHYYLLKLSCLTHILVNLHVFIFRLRALVQNPNTRQLNLQGRCYLIWLLLLLNMQLSVVDLE